MRKIAKIFMVLLSVLTLSGCGTNVTIEEKRTIVLNVDSEVVPSFASNFGTGTYDETSKTYTHVIEYIKDLYISLSYEDLKTVTVYIPTKDMNEDVITRNISFGEELDAEVEVTVEGVKTLEGLQINSSLQYSDLKIGKKNTFKFKLASREENYNLKFTLPNYKEFDIYISEDDLVSGNAKIETVAVANDQIYIGLEGSGYEYRIYSMSTNKIVASGDIYGGSGVKFNILPNDSGYYVEIFSYRCGNKLIKVPLNENIIINGGKEDTNTNGNFRIGFGDDQNNYDWRLYNKDEKIISNQGTLYAPITSYGLIVIKNNSEALYLDDLSSKVISQDSWDYQYTFNYEDFVEVDYDITIIDAMTGEIISNEIKEYFYYGYDIESAFENNVFYVTIEELKEGYINIDLYSKDNEKVETISQYMGGKFEGSVFSGNIEYKGKTIPYTFPVFLEDLVYNNGEYTYPNVTIDVDVSFLSIKVLEADKGYVESLSTSDYIMDEDQEVIMGESYGGNAYFELYEGKTYTFKHNNVQYSFTVTQSHIESGMVLVIGENVEKISVKLPKDYYIVLDSLSSAKFYPNNEGVVNLPKENHDSMSITLCNEFVSFNQVIYLNGSPLYELRPFYVAEGVDFSYTDDNMNYYVNSQEGSNGMIYSSFDTYGYTLPDLINTDTIGRLGTLHYDYYKIPVNKFTYNEEYQAYYYNMKEDFDHIVILNSEDASMISWSEVAYYYGCYDEDDQYYVVAYVNDGMVIEYEEYSYTIGINDSKYLKANIEYVSDHYELIITQANN